MEWFVITDLNEFTEKVRNIVYNNFGKWHDNQDVDIEQTIDNVADKQDLDKILTQQESILIVKELVRRQKNRDKTKTRYIVNDEIFLDIVEKLNSRMVSNVLKELVAKNLIESSYDSELDDFVFWVKDK